MAELEYPTSLPAPQTMQVSSAERRASATPDRPRESRALQRDRKAYEQITWPPMTRADCDVFWNWWRNTLILGGAWFKSTWPGPRGQVAAVRKFYEQPTAQLVAVGLWRISAVCEVRGAGLFPTYPQASLIHAWWGLSENGAGTRFADSSPFDNHLITTESTSAHSVATSLGNSYQRTGNDDEHVSVRLYLPRTHADLDFGPEDSFTIGLWSRKIDGTGNLTRMVMGRQAGTAALPTDAGFKYSAYGIETLNQSVSFFVRQQEDGTERSVNGFNGFPLDEEMHFFVGVCDPLFNDGEGVLRLYVDGTQYGSAVSLQSRGGARRGPDIKANFCLGHAVWSDTRIDENTGMTTAQTGTSNTRQYAGYMAKAFAAQRAMSDADVAFLFNGGAGRTYLEARAAGLFDSA